MLHQVRGTGVLVPRENRWIVTFVEARVERLLARPGEMVNPETILLEMSNPNLVQEVREVRSALIAAEAEYGALEARRQAGVLDQRAAVAKARFEYESARLQVEAEAKLVDDGTIPRVQYQRSQLLTEQLRERLAIEEERSPQVAATMHAELRAGIAEIERLQGELEYREERLGSLQVVAGVHGVLQELSVEEGQRVEPGENIARVADQDTLMAELRIAEIYAKDVQLGQAVDIDTRNGIVPGEVVRIDPRVSNGAVLVDVKLTGELPAGARPHLSIDGAIRVETLEDVLYLNRPVHMQPESRASLFLLDKDGQMAERVPVEFGRSSAGVIEIRDGLNLGDTVIVSDASAWEEFDALLLSN
jgi:HlyD family secretion protein